MSTEWRQRAVVWTCIAAIFAVVANSVWQWRTAAEFGWSGLGLKPESHFKGYGRVSRHEARLSIDEVEPGSPASAAGLRKGESITKLNGSAEDLVERFFSLRPGVAEVVVDRRPPTALRLRLVAPLSRPSVILACLWNAFVGLLAVAIGALVYRKKRDDPRTYILFVLTSLYALVRFTSVGPVHQYGLDFGPILIQALTWVWAGLLFFPALLHFFLVFPKPRPAVQSDPRRPGRLYAPAVVIGLAVTVFVIMVLRFTPGTRHAADALAYINTNWSFIAALEPAALLLALVAAAFAAVHGIRATRDEYRARRWRGVLLRSPSAVLLATAGIALLISILLRVIGVVFAGASILNVAALLIGAIGIGVSALATAVIVLVVYPLAACVVLWRNYRESSNVERRQLRWPLLGLVLAVAGFLLTDVALALGAWAWGVTGDSTAALIVFHLSEELPDTALLLIPLSLAFAVLRYRLMDIDVYVRKTIIYGGATGLLTVVFLAVVAGVGKLLIDAFGQAGEWLPVAATLAVGALFVPVRGRIQQEVDRRFYRKRDYPAALSRLTGVTDAQTIADIVQESIPARAAALWLASKEAPVYELRAVTGGIDPSSEQRLPVADAAPRLRADGSYVVPIRRDGAVMGYLTVGAKLADTPFDDDDGNFLQTVATHIGLTAGADRRDDEQAAAIQRALLPATLPELPGVRLSGVWQPARAVGGDYYDVFRLGDSRLGLAIADVAGKGMAAALLMSNVQAALKLLAPDMPSPAALCTRLNGLICSNIAPGRFVTFFYALLDAGAGTLTYCNAGHNPPLLLRPAGGLVKLETGGVPLGLLPATSYTEDTEEIAAGSRLLLYTDGVCDASDQEGLEFGEQRLHELLQSHIGADAETLQRTVREQVTRHCGGVFSDDVTIVAVTMQPAAAASSA
ncbi:MAG TPA: SpoIIE family protein phosphatase [Bryobacteraceae bacterium]|nr:SpoIIE family protein phosphatase [Bryobacteraceae bacterium]